MNKTKGFTVLTSDKRPLGFYTAKKPSEAVCEALLERGHDVEPSKYDGVVEITSSDRDDLLPGVYYVIESPDGQEIDCVTVK